MAGIFFSHLPSFLAQEPQRQHRECHVVMPTDPTPHFVVIEPDFALGGLEHLFDSMSFAVSAHQFTQGDLGAGVAQGVFELRLAHDPGHEQPLFRADLAIEPGANARRHRVDIERAFLAGADG